MRTLLALSLLLTASLAHAEDEAVLAKPQTANAPIAGRTLWRTSIAALVAAHAIDIHSSWGKHELNPTLASGNGNFGREGALIKVALTGGLLGIEYLVTRRSNPNSKLQRALAAINFGAAGAVGSVAMHNYSVARPR